MTDPAKEQLDEVAEEEERVQEDPLAAAEAKAQQHLDDLKRLAADFDNYRKRVAREQEALSTRAAERLVKELLPIVDDLERALKAPATGDVDSFKMGIELIHQQMLELLRKRGVKPIDAVGTEFDPRYHQAVAQETSADHREGEVMEEFARGYVLGDRLLRPAMVKVAKA